MHGLRTWVATATRSGEGPKSQLMAVFSGAATPLEAFESSTCDIECDQHWNESRVKTPRAERLGRE